MEKEFYQEYLAWFAEKAKVGEVPLSWKEIFHTFLFSRTLREDPQKALAWDQAYFITWIHLAQTRSGRPEWFLFTAVDMLPMDQDGDVLLEPIWTAYARVTDI